jgi:hypothetical protein
VFCTSHFVAQINNPLPGLWSHNQQEMTSLSLSATDCCVLVAAAEVIKFAF